jgi:peptidoglycan/LPS O-acetylase OafA/YrhL
MAKPLIPTLDGWRAIAIMGVIFSHVQMELSPNGEALAYRVGNVGVSLFFAISGFLITTLLLDEEQERGRISLRSFYMRRAFRILPAAFTFLGIIAIAGQWKLLPLKSGEILASALFFNNYWPNHSWFTAHFWSLSIEEHFYLVWPFVLLKASSKRALYFALAGALATLVWRPVGLTLYPSTAIHRTDLRLDAFMYAAIVAILHHRGYWIPLFTYRFTVPLFSLFLTATYVAGRGSHVLGLNVFKQTLEALLLPVIIASAVSSPQSWVARCLSQPLFCWIGRISYSLYLWQQICISPYFPGNIVVQLFALLTCASLSVYLIENPCRRYVRRLEAAARYKSSVAIGFKLNPGES